MENGVMSIEMTQDSPEELSTTSDASDSPSSPVFDGQARDLKETNKWIVLALASTGLFISTSLITSVLVSLPSTLEALSGSILSTSHR